MGVTVVRPNAKLFSPNDLASFVTHEWYQRRQFVITGQVDSGLA